MAHLSPENKTSIDTLKKAYDDLSWFKKLFFPKKMKEALTAYQNSSGSTESAMLVVRQSILEKNSGFLSLLFFTFSQWAYSCLAIFSEEPLVKASRKLDLNNLLSDTYFNPAAKCSDSEGMVNCFLLLHENNLLKQPYLDAVAESRDPYNMSNAIRELKQNNILTEFNFNDVVQHPRPYYVALAFIFLEYLKSTNRATGEIRDEMLRNQDDPESAAKALSILDKCQLLVGPNAKANFEAVAKNENPSQLFAALRQLQDSGLTLLRGPEAQSNFEAVANAEEPIKVASRIYSEAATKSGLYVIDHTSLWRSDTTSPRADANNKSESGIPLTNSGFGLFSQPHSQNNDSLDQETNTQKTLSL